MLVGRDLIKAAEIRAQISQIEKYNQAVNTFRGKYDALPGDINVINAQKYGFYIPLDCTGQQGGRDGNGLIDGYFAPYPLAQFSGETQLFWQDLSVDGLIPEHFPSSSAPYYVTCHGSGVLTSSTAVATSLPQAKLGNNNFVYVFETSGENWFGMEMISASFNGGAWPVSGMSIPVYQAYQIDKKLDDGIPIAGKVRAIYIATNNLTTITLANASGVSGGDANSCFDTITGVYSITQNSGSGMNCALSFKFQ